MKRAILFFALLGALVFGCDSESGKTYDVPVSWNIGGAQTCSQLVGPIGDQVQVDFDDMRISVYEDEEATEPLESPVTATCSDFEYTIPRLERGSYLVKVEAMGEYDGEDLPIYSGTIEIAAPYDEDEDDNEVGLLLSKGSVHVTWSFDNGLMCGPNDVEMMSVSMSGDETEVECSVGELEVSDLMAFTNYDLSIEALDVDGDVVFDGDYEDNSFYLVPGETLDAHVVLD